MGINEPMGTVMAGAALSFGYSPYDASPSSISIPDTGQASSNDELTSLG
jgi:hypothetical protein